eukprot:8312832-Pyramimonas_sp.AAC.1
MGSPDRRTRCDSGALRAGVWFPLRSPRSCAPKATLTQGHSLTQGQDRDKSLQSVPERSQS